MLNTTKGVDPKEEKRSKVKVEADAVINFRQLAVGADEQAEVRVHSSRGTGQLCYIVVARFSSTKFTASEIQE